MFTGFTDETIRFFLDLRFHNSTSWFHENHDRYRREVVAPFYALIEDLAPAALEADRGIEIRPHKCLSRINRDIRFSKDKSPYRDHLWFCFRHGGEPREGSLNFWFEFGPDRLSWGMGTWGENRPMMDAFRRRCQADPQGMLEEINGFDLAKKQLRPEAVQWKKMPVPDNIPPELRGWYLAREIYVSRLNIDFGWAFRKELKDMVEADFRSCIPVYRLLRRFYESENNISV